jgi:hypothetical protein
VFFLACVIVAGLYGAATAFVSILFVQALLALLAVLASQRRDGANYRDGRFLCISGQRGNERHGLLPVRWTAIENVSVGLFGRLRPL